MIPPLVRKVALHLLVALVAAWACGFVFAAMAWLVMILGLPFWSIQASCLASALLGAVATPYRFARVVALVAAVGIAVLLVWPELVRAPMACKPIGVLA